MEKSKVGYRGKGGPAFGVGCCFRWVLREGFAEGCGSMIHGSPRKEHSRQRDWSGQKLAGSFRVVSMTEGSKWRGEGN